MKNPRTEHGFIISPYNKKLGYIPSLSVPKGLTCPKDVPCRTKCYVERMNKYTGGATNKTYMVNYDKMVAESGWVTLIKDVTEYIQEHEPRYFRWNVSGDIFSYWYMWAICEIAKRCNGTNFLVFTKQYQVVDKYISIRQVESIPSNLSIYLSEWGNYKPSERLKQKFNVAYFQDKAGNIKIDDKSAIECPGTCEKCKRCFKNQGNVVFVEH